MAPWWIRRVLAFTINGQPVDRIVLIDGPLVDTACTSVHDQWPPGGQLVQ